MTLSDSLLLQINQKRTSYNDLVTKMLPNYSSKNSAKAALSRELKNMIAFGNVKKDKGYYVLTEKGKEVIKSKLENKIFVNINKVVEKVENTNKFELIDELVKDMQIFLERSKQDKSLLRIGKAGTFFYISDLKRILKNLNKKISHLDYLSSVFEKQILNLQEMNFENIKILKLNKKAFRNIKNLVDFYNLDKILIEVDSKEIKDIFESNYFLKKKSDNIFQLDSKNLDYFKDLIFDNLKVIVNNKLKIYINEILIIIKENKVYFTGPHNIIVDIK